MDGSIPDPCGHQDGYIEVSLEGVRALTEIRVNTPEQMSKDLYNVVVQVMKGDSFTVVHGVRSANGIPAWRRIHHTDSPLAPAMALSDLLRVMSPGRVKNHEESLANIAEW